MLHPAHKLGVAVILCGLLFLPNAILGQKGKALEIKDEAKLFGEKAIGDANAIIAKIKEKHRKDLFIETVEKGPDRSAVEKWATKRAESAGVQGVYIVISTEPKIFEIYVSPRTREKGYITQTNRDELRKILAMNLKDNRDEALVKVAKFVMDTMDEAGKKFAPRLVKDDAKLFSEDAIKDANAVVTKIRDQFDKDLFIETMEKGPAQNEFAAFTRDRARKLGIDGVYVLITKEPKRFQVDVDDKTTRSGLFTTSDRDELAQKILPGLAKDRDETLSKMANFVFEAINLRGKPAKGDEASAKIDVAEAQLSVLTKACNAYWLEYAEFPMALTDLVQMKGNVTFLGNKDTLIDPWKQAFQYDVSGPKNMGKQPDIWAVTPDKQVIGNWMLKRN